MRAFLFALSLSLISATAHADIWGYVDAQGDAHFATEKLDGRYQLFMRGDGTMNASRLTPMRAEPDTPLMRYLSQHPNLKKYEQLLNQAADEYQLDPALLKAVMAAESGFNPAAVSPKGAIGLMQLMPATAERFGLQGDSKRSIKQKLADPKTNIRLGARYLRFLEDMYPHQLHLMLASYNAGEGAVQKYNNAIPPYPETRNYVKLVTQFYRMYQPAADGFNNVATRGTFISRVSNANGDGRIHMTIPGRRNASADSTSSIEQTSQQ
ncbi:MAG TPA: lytic transglycosylase domain-containing protein [Oxalicibacterium sp.]|uniref:lytic transglycosylase domain-containing protein n=1 Tax=Oxalicibacterium sp. TaxID=2766525 RepID=UPI002BE77170|nr:lytic transglycosylase domain-containing protein [Oxalicibacterium sp.]HWU99057.1 lytic transglycosylase domain-containing protein [Oxalicibacterium sp.]